MRLFLSNIVFLWLCCFGDLSVMAEVKMNVLVDDNSDLQTAMHVDKQSETKVIINQKTSNAIFKPNELIFEELFEASKLSNWTSDKFIHSNFFGDLAEDFTALSSDNIEVYNGKLFITPTISKFSSGHKFNVSGCRRPACYENNDFTCKYENTRERAYAYPPPVNSARITTNGTFSFTYGRIEINAILPKGDWLFPYIMLMPDKLNCTMRKQLRIAFAKSVDLENNNLLGGPVILQGQRNPQSNKDYFTRISHMATERNFYADGFHNFTMVWTSKGVSMYVDGKQYGYVENNGDYAEPYHIALGIGAGGHLEFEDTSSKPWRNGANVAFAYFHRSFKGCCARSRYGVSYHHCFENKREIRCSTLWGSQATMVVESVRVYAV
ncbi:gram-negative bacteria-binding protein 2-like [Zeugodacus cucurbitae]|uniref:gram-negative bacteria-binding protein 2-like n=1 Tax=Zeugodacus cucurbitae TaxID=28588 RepID=UPI0023D8F533|nr:gram-negative bacteria-binding protein 2-like [Zeugodacus cucurbitae]